MDKEEISDEDEEEEEEEEEEEKETSITQNAKNKVDWRKH